jgi:excisionase family DNA binding protein
MNSDKNRKPEFTPTPKDELLVTGFTPTTKKFGVGVYTIEEIAEILKVHRTYVATLIRDKKLSALKIGRFYRIREDQLEKLIGGKLVAMLTVDDVAETLKIHRTYVARLIKQKKLKAIKIGKFYRIREDKFNAFLEESEI